LISQWCEVALTILRTARGAGEDRDAILDEDASSRPRRCASERPRIDCMLGMLADHRYRARANAGAYARQLRRDRSAQRGQDLAVAGDSTANGAPVVQQTGNASWALALSTDNTYILRYVPTGKVLDVNGGDPTVGLQLQQWTANGGTNQMWFVQLTGDEFYTIVSHDSSLLVDVFQQATTDGASVGSGSWLRTERAQP
jgi:hypothetical protein